MTNDDLALTGKTALAHLKAIKDYRTRLDRMEADAEALRTQAVVYLSAAPRGVSRRLPP